MQKIVAVGSQRLQRHAAELRCSLKFYGWCYESYTFAQTR